MEVRFIVLKLDAAHRLLSASQAVGGVLLLSLRLDAGCTIFWYRASFEHMAGYPESEPQAT
jgi:hypothetical protein